MALCLISALAFSSYSVNGFVPQVHPKYSRSIRPISSENHLRAHANGDSPLSGYSVRDSFNLLVLGDLHMEDDMTKHLEAQNDCVQALRDLSLIPCPNSGSSDDSDDKTVASILSELKEVRAGDLGSNELEMLLTSKREGDLMKSFMVSLGDLGRKDIRHEQGDAGTTKSFLDAKTFLDGFNLPYDLVTGNHDLEGLGEFDTDEENLSAFLRCFNRDTAQFCRQIGEKTLLVGMSTVRFRDAPYSSHEVHIDDRQIEWFENILKSHPASDGWRILVFSHAPVMGSGLRVLQNVHIKNGCAWLNHCSENRGVFVRLVKENPQVKMWFSGHFHLSHDYEDSISTVGSCTFVQAGVVGPVSTRDGRRQTRLVRGNSEKLKIYTVQHHLRGENDKAEVRLDAEIDLGSDIVTLTNDSEDYDREDWFGAYVPQKEDGCYIETPNGRIASPQTVDSVVCWWHMSDGAVLGVHDGQLVEYDAETLSPLGIVVPKKELNNREVLVVNEGTAVVLVSHEDGGKDMEVVHPNDDGSYWRKFQRNKKVRQEEKAREAVARLWLDKQ